MIEKLKLEGEYELVIFKDDDFWDKVLPDSIEESQWVDILTYNFNFSARYQETMYKKLEQLSEKGIDIRLLFGKMPKDEDEVKSLTRIFKLSIPVFFLERNHSKIFLSKNRCFIGSANFSFGSKSNYECGIILKEPEQIQKIRKFVIENIFYQAKLLGEDYEDYGDSLYVYDTISLLRDIFYEKDIVDVRAFIDSELFYKLRYYKDAIKLAQKKGYCINDNPIIWEIMDQKLSGKQVSEEMIHEFEMYALQLLCELTEFKDIMIKAFEEIGRTKFYDEIYRNNKWNK